MIINKKITDVLLSIIMDSSEKNIIAQAARLSQGERRHLLSLMEGARI